MFKFIKITDKFQIGMYGVCIAVGLLLCFFMLNKFQKAKKIDEDFYNKFETTGIIAIIGGLFFAFLFQAIYHYIETGVFDLFNSGLTFIGGLIGGVITFFVTFFIIYRKNFWEAWRNFNKLLPIVPGCITIAHACGRMGCFCAGCCYGMETDSWLGMEFKYGASVGTKVYPTQLYEAIFLFILAAVFIFLAFKYECKYNLGIYLISYGVFRFLIEYIRGDERGEFIPGMSPSQFWSIWLVVAGIALICFMKFYKATWYHAKLEAIDKAKLEEENSENKIETTAE